MVSSVLAATEPFEPDISTGETDFRAMAVATALFFMVGFLTCLNDVIIPHLKSIFELSYAEAMLVQFAFFSSYFVFSYPGSRLIDAIGYKRTMVAGLLLMGKLSGRVPACRSTCQLSGLPHCAGCARSRNDNGPGCCSPYVTIIGPPATASSRLNLAQAFNSVGTFIAPSLGAIFILKGAKPLSSTTPNSMSEASRQLYRVTEASTDRFPYLGMALVLLLLAIGLASIKLRPQQSIIDQTRDFRPGACAAHSLTQGSIWQRPRLLAGAVGIFVYVGAEVSIGSLLISFMQLPSIAGFPQTKAAAYLMIYWGGAMVGRFIGSAILRRIPTGLLLGAAAVCSFGCILTAVSAHGHLAMYALLAVGFCNSIMFPSIFTLEIQGLGPLTSKGSSLMIAAIVG